MNNITQHRRLLLCKKILLSAIFFCLLILATRFTWYSTSFNNQLQSLAGFSPGHAGIGFIRAQLLHLKSPGSKTSCILPSGGFQSWRQGVVSVIQPLSIQRKCLLLFGRNETEAERIKIANLNSKALVYESTNTYEIDAQDCSVWREEFNDKLFYTSEEEKAFPLAFSFVVNRNPQQFIRLIKSIYRPHNIHCIHVDKKSSSFTKNIVNNLTKCIPNIIVPQQSVSVYRGHISIVTAQMRCIKQLYSMRSKYPWKYVITLCGMELPLRTNKEMVRMLQLLNGTSAIRADLTSLDEMTRRFKYKQVLVANAIKPKKTKNILDPPPYNITVYKSSAYNGLSVKFVEYLLHDKVAKEVYEYMKYVGVPEEHYVATLFMLPGTPGGYNTSHMYTRTERTIPTISSVIWLIEKRKHDWPKLCSGTIIHYICIINSGDLHRLRKFIMGDFLKHPKGPFFHNKYHMERDRTVMDCMEEQLVNRNGKEYEIDCLS